MGLRPLGPEANWVGAPREGSGHGGESPPESHGTLTSTYKFFTERGKNRGLNLLGLDPGPEAPGSSWVGTTGYLPYLPSSPGYSFLPNLSRFLCRPKRGHPTLRQKDPQIKSTQVKERTEIPLAGNRLFGGGGVYKRFVQE